jgi:catecholate siderophore receptor
MQARSSSETNLKSAFAGLPAATIALALTGGLQAADEAPNADDATIELPKMTVEEQRRAVSSPKFTVPLVDTPQTISIITSDIFNSQGASNLSDVLRNTPGITFAAGEGGNVASGDSFFMRGFDASSSIFIDGVRDSGAYNRDTYNLEQVEIAKGPAGADTGRGGSSGYINLATKTPTVNAAQSGQVIYGDAADGKAQQRATIDINQPLNASSAIRVAALWQDSGVPGRDHVKNSSWGVSPSLAFGLGQETQVSLGATIDRLDNLPDSGLPVVALPGAVLPGGTPVTVDQSNFYGLVGRDYDKIDRTSLTARIAHDFSGLLRLTNQTKWIDTGRDALTTYFQNSSTAAVTFAAATTPVNPATGATPPSYVGYNPATGEVTPRRIHTETANQILSNQTNIATQFSIGRTHHSASAGLELSREEQTVPVWSPVGGPTTSLIAPDAHRAASAAQTPYLAANNPFTRGRIDTAALYAFDTIQLNPRFLLNASVRWEAYEIDYESLAAATASVPSPALVRLNAKNDIFSWKTGLVFKPSPRGSLYVAIANTFTPPGSGFALSATAGNQNNPNVDPLESRNYEIGAKWEILEGRLSTNLAFYRSENFNFTSTDAVTGLPTQDISQNVQGVELGVSGKLNQDWLIFGGIGYIDSEYQAAGTTSAANDGAGLRFTPRLSGNLWTTYALAKRLTVGGGLQYTESVVRSTANNQAPTATSIISVPDYWLANLMAAYAVNDKLTLRLNLNNVTDEFSYRLNNNGGRYYAGAPRSFLLTADWKF